MKKSKAKQSFKFLKKIIEKEKEKYEPIDYQDIVDLGTPMNITDLPEGMVKKFGSACKKFNCRQKKLQQSCQNLLKEVNNIIVDTQII